VGRKDLRPVKFCRGPLKVSVVQVLEFLSQQRCLSRLLNEGEIQGATSFSRLLKTERRFCLFEATPDPACLWCRCTSSRPTRGPAVPCRL
jgi:hypothetical protein